MREPNGDYGSIRGFAHLPLIQISYLGAKTSLQLEDSRRNFLVTHINYVLKRQQRMLIAQSHPLLITKIAKELMTR